MKKRYFAGRIGQWIAAALVAFACVNLLSAAYELPLLYIPRDKNATDMILLPFSRILHGTEGRGRALVDARGYVNEALPLSQSYILTLGSSYTQGKEVAMDERYTALVNAQLGGEDAERLHLYNVSKDAWYYPLIVKGFRALLCELPPPSAVVLEISSTAYETAELAGAVDQRAYDAAQTGEMLGKSLSTGVAARLAVKRLFPALGLIGKNLSALAPAGGRPFFPETAQAAAPEAPDENSARENEAALKRTLLLLGEEYGGPIFILYHPNVSFTPDGALKLERDDGYAVFRAACAACGIRFIDTGEAFLRAYESEYAIPYGFSNTAPGTGHLNRAGHRAVAEALYGALKEAGIA